MPKRVESATKRAVPGWTGEEASLPHKSPENVTGTDSSGICSLCSPVLTRYVSDFKGMVHRGGELKRRKSINPHPTTKTSSDKMSGSEPMSLIVLGTISIAVLVYGPHLV